MTIIINSKRGVASQTHKPRKNRREVVYQLSTMENRINHVATAQDDLTRKLDNIIKVRIKVNFITINTIVHSLYIIS